MGLVASTEMGDNDNNQEEKLLGMKIMTFVSFFVKDFLIVSTSFDFQLSERRLPLWKYRLVFLCFFPFVISFPAKGSNSTFVVTLFLCGSGSTFQYDMTSWLVGDKGGCSGYLCYDSEMMWYDRYSSFANHRNRRH